ncbi:MAG: nucleotidyltransferase domain-containing protein [Methanomassiliicoccaceae archaeon]|nr:nucleotidyltransferase domain-containing protein [Methanomassiliicoccaceae archaeon]
MGSAETKCNLTFEELCDIVAPIAEKRGVERIYLFGSRARGDNGEESDYDFYIMPGRIRSLMGLGGLMNDLEEALGTGVDIITEDPHIKENFMKEMLRDRRLVYEV